MSNKKSHSSAHSGSIRKRSDGRWEARYTVGFDPKTGKQIQKSIYGKTQNAVRQKLTSIVAEIDSGTYIEPSKMTLNQWLDIWLADYLINLKPSTAFLYERVAATYIRPSLGEKRLDVLSAHEVQHLYNDMLNGRGFNKALSAKTVKDVHGILHRCLNQALQMNYIKHNPTSACVLPRKANKKIMPMTDEQLNDFLQRVKGDKYELEYIVFLFTGMRESELLGLMWDCVNFENGTILVDKQLVKDRRKGGTYYFSEPKNGKSRIITPAPYVMKILRLQKNKQNILRMQAGQAWEESGLVFTNELGRYVSYRAIYDSYKKVVTEMGAPHLRLHDLRHTYAVNSIRAGDDIKTVQENLGHATAAFTLDVYAHFTDDMKQASAARMEQFIVENVCI